MAEMPVLTITNLEAVVTKLRLEPGDCLLVRYSGDVRRETHAEIQAAFEETFGCPVVVLPPELTLEAVLNMPPELIERAREVGRERQEKNMRRFREAIAKKAGPPPVVIRSGVDDAPITEARPDQIVASQRSIA
jgi:hypothetical protein